MNIFGDTHGREKWRNLGETNWKKQVRGNKLEVLHEESWICHFHETYVIYYRIMRP